MHDETLQLNNKMVYVQTSAGICHQYIIHVHQLHGKIISKIVMIVRLRVQQRGKSVENQFTEKKTVILWERGIPAN
jgi:hypothetical protein